jgi:hypothetical protein
MTSLVKIQGILQRSYAGRRGRDRDTYALRTYRDSSPSFGWSDLPVSSSSESPSFVLFLAPNEKGDDTFVILFLGVQEILDFLDSESITICFSFPSNSDGFILVIWCIPMFVCLPGLSSGSPVL